MAFWHILGFLSILLICLVYVVQADEEFKTIGNSTSGKINMVDIKVPVKSYNKAKKAISQKWWYEKCAGSKPGKGLKHLYKKLRHQIHKTVAILQSEADLDEIAEKVNSRVKQFMESYDKDAQEGSFTDIEFEKVKMEFSSYASKMKLLREKMGEFKKKRGKIYSYCMDMLENMRFMKAAGLKQTKWKNLSILGNSGVLMGYAGFAGSNLMSNSGQTN
ncbi:uncharacterized protein LOC116351239 [Contarinia nasturtii]|uniref:uncharacterized protein LOC116351239 n=1 Tax=Contarinia nasturtii TaxID=265458 RepID=UPI0012D4A59B|nr:uncharacterized protein LOC116351239 [Contarinia nasturtii]